MSNVIRHRLKEALIARGMSPAELAKTIGVGNGYISQLLAGYISQPKKNLTAICQALRVREQWMLTGKGPADADDEYDGITKVPLINGNGTNNTYLECYGVKDTTDLVAYILTPSPFFDEETKVIVTKRLEGNGLFLLEFKGNLIISHRKGDFISVEWHHFTTLNVIDSNIKVIGKIIQITLSNQKDVC